MDINVFTAAMRMEFQRAYQSVADPAPYELFTTEVPSTARIENYTIQSSPPGVKEYLGRREFAQIDPKRYTVVNKEYDGGIAVGTRDVEDDQVGSYMMSVRDLGLDARQAFKARLTLQTMALGASTLCFDGTNFFATTHNLGSAGSVPNGFGGGGNAITFDAASNDAVTHKFVLCFHDRSLKPFMYQNRKQPVLMTDAGTPASHKSKRADYWVDLEAAAAFGYWWDAILVTITDTPTIVELATCLDAALLMLRSFKLPKAMASSPDQRVHEQKKPSAANSTVICSLRLERLFTHLLNDNRIGVSVAGATAGIANNIYYNRHGLVTSGFLGE